MSHTYRSWHETYKRPLLDSAQKLLMRSLQSASYVSPTANLTNVPKHSLCAANLTITDDSSGHFSVMPLKDFFRNTGVVKTVDGQDLNFADFEQQLESSLKINRDMAKSPCWTFKKNQAVIMRNYEIRMRIETEADLSYVIGDPLITMLCEVLPLEGKFVESVSSQVEEQSYLDVHVGVPSSSSSTPAKASARPSTFVSPSSKASLAVTPSCHADYTGYRCVTLESRWKDEIVAVIIEAKLVKHHKFQHAVSQVIGYYISMTCDKMTTPLVFVVSDAYIEIILFPFHDEKDDPFVNAVRLGKMPIWNEVKEFDISVMQALYSLLELRINKVELLGRLILADSTGVFKRAVRDRVLSIEEWERKEIDELKEKHKKELEEKDKELEEIDKELRENEKLIEEKNKLIELLQKSITK